MRLRVVTILTALSLAAALSAAAQPIVLTIDLAAMEPNAERTLPVDAGLYSVVIINKAPSLTYKVTVATTTQEIPVLPIPKAGAAPLPPNDPCRPLNEATGQLRNTQDEKEVGQLVPRIQSLLAGSQCSDSAIIDAAKKALAATREPLPGQEALKLGQQLKVTIVGTVGTATRIWTVLYQTPARGRWVASYGFTFLPARDERYFTKAKMGEANTFVITEKEDRQDLGFAPSVFFSWLSTKDEVENWSFSWSAGLGFDQSNPIVFAGPMWTYNQNVGVILGLVMHKQKRLDGQYKENEEIMANLTESQLHEETYRPNLFLGLSYRFGAKPFPSSAGGSSSDSSSDSSSGGPSSGGAPAAGGATSRP